MTNFFAEAEASLTPNLSDAELWAAVVTFHRPSELAAMLAAIQRQTKPADHLVIVDNGSDANVRAVADKVGADYIDPGDNLGPAGGVATAMEHVLARASDEDWLLLLDDDNPPEANDAFEALWRFGHQRKLDDPTTGGVGSQGGFYNPRLGVWHRPGDEDLVGPVRVDVTGGGYLPMYRCDVIRKVGTFDRALFFGFEEGEYGQRLRSRGYSMWADGDRWLAGRTAAGQLGIKATQAKTSHKKAAWRRYYGIRNATIVAWRYGRAWTPFLVAAGGALLGVRALVRARRPLREMVLPIRGAVDGLLQRTGRTVDPGLNRKED